MEIENAACARCPCVDDCVEAGECLIEMGVVRPAADALQNTLPKAAAHVASGDDLALPEEPDYIRALLNKNAHLTPLEKIATNYINSLLSLVRKLKERLATREKRIGWFEKAGGVAMATKIHSTLFKLEVAERKLVEAEKKRIYGFYEDYYPVYTQGTPTHELQEPVEVDELNGLVTKFKEAINLLKESLSSIEEIHTDRCSAWCGYRELRRKISEFINRIKKTGEE